MPRAEAFGRLMEQALRLLRTHEFEALESEIRASALRQLGLDPVTDVGALDFHFAPFSVMDFYRSLQLRVREYGSVTDASELGEGIQNALVLAILQAFERRRKAGAIFLMKNLKCSCTPRCSDRWRRRYGRSAAQSGHLHDSLASLRVCACL